MHISNHLISGEYDDEQNSCDSDGSALTLIFGVSLKDPIEAKVEMGKQTGIISIRNAMKAARNTDWDHVISTSFLLIGGTFLPFPMSETLHD